MTLEFGLAPAPEAGHDDHTLALALATAAGRLLLEVREELADAGVRILRDAGDTRSQDLLAGLLARTRPRDAVLSEEAADDRSRLAARRVWIIDPLDGTREFAEPGREDWAVHVALWEDGQLVAGSVTLPASGQAFATAPACPPPPAPDPGQSLRLAVSRSRPPAFVADVAELLGADLVPMGSAGAKTMSVVTGVTHAYLHSGGQFEWDSAAPVAVAAAAGLATSRLDGSPLVYNRPDPYLPDLVVCHPGVVDRIRGAIDEVTGA